jgi:cobalt/nickel transport protein
MKKEVRNWLIISLLIGGVLSLFASSSPDGFEKAGQQVGYIDHAVQSVMPAPLPDYQIPGVGSWISGSVAGLIGVVLTFVVFLALGKWITGRSGR